MPADVLDQALADLHRLVYGAEHCEPGVTDVERLESRENQTESAGDVDPFSEESANSSVASPGVRVRIELGRTRISKTAIGELLRGGLLTLDRMANDPVDLVVDGRVVARGELLKMDGSVGIRICEIVAKRNSPPGNPDEKQPAV
ncbi:MAG: FliM/FliN family flagellar motor switch protein [Planctomycetota bacterium]|nr:FliM/FliN family flagellar motor switch protein [Planctomycetota bacterium]